MAAETVYRITGRYKYGLRGAVNRVTVRRASGHLAHYPTLANAKRGLAGFKGPCSRYENLRIEELTGHWMVWSDSLDTIGGV